MPISLGLLLSDQYDSDKNMSVQNRCEPPWFLIARQAVRGTSLETLSVRFKVSVEDIRRHLDRAIVSTANGELYVRSNAEISQASKRVRNDLVSILMEAIDELSVSTLPRLSQLAEFEKLLTSAAKLFQWPTMQATRYLHTSHGATTIGEVPLQAAVNLDLIATSPEELARIADRQRAIELGQAQAARANGPLQPQSQPTQQPHEPLGLDGYVQALPDDPFGNSGRQSDQPD